MKPHTRRQEEREMFHREPVFSKCHKKTERNRSVPWRNLLQQMLQEDRKKEKCFTKNPSSVNSAKRQKERNVPRRTLRQQMNSLHQQMKRTVSENAISEKTEVKSRGRGKASWCSG